MLHTTITITKTVTETSEMTATACYSEGTATPDPSVNPGTISDQTCELTILTFIISIYSYHCNQCLLFVVLWSCSVYYLYDIVLALVLLEVYSCTIALYACLYIYSVCVHIFTFVIGVWHDIWDQSVIAAVYGVTSWMFGVKHLQLVTMMYISFTNL